MPMIQELLFKDFHDLRADAANGLKLNEPYSREKHEGPRKHPPRAPGKSISISGLKRLYRLNEEDKSTERRGTALKLYLVFMLP